jgi:hypothetical protein
MVTKIIEIHDSGTFIPALAVRLGSPNEAERYLLARSGFGRTMEDQSEYIVLCKINGGEPCSAHIDPFAWGQNPRTMFVAHMYLLNRHHEFEKDKLWCPSNRAADKHDGFDALPQGVVVDVEFILGRREAPKTAEWAG